VITGQVKESKTFYIEDMLENAQGMLVTLRVRMLDEVWKWVLGWGAEMEVLEPVALRERVQEEAQLMIRRYT
jgi:predicted DNA-binding transcriptional regulator YafY